MKESTGISHASIVCKTCGVTERNVRKHSRMLSRLVKQGKEMET
ncbi:MAG: hypothetical protein ACFFCS_21930 [Candidatus Hodarchaeota archaeon]